MEMPIELDVDDDDDDIAEALHEAPERDLVDLAGILGMHQFLSQPQYEKALLVSCWTSSIALNCIYQKVVFKIFFKIEFSTVFNEYWICRKLNFYSIFFCLSRFVFQHFINFLQILMWSRLIFST